MFVREWKEAQNPVGVVFLFHGMGAHSGEASVRETAAHFASKYHVIALDQVGHGRTPSEENFGWIESYEHFVQDGLGLIANITSQDEYKDKPFFIAGHSLGGTVTLYLSLELQKSSNTNWKGSILIAPAIHQSLSPSWIEVKLLELVLASGGTKLPLGPTPNPETFPSFQDYEEYMTDPWTYSKGLTLGFGFNALQMLEHLLPRLSEVKFPFLILHCKDDPVTPITGSRELYQLSQTPPELKVLKEYKKCFHTPMTCGEEKKQCVEDTLSWMQSRLNSK